MSLVACVLRLDRLGVEQGIKKPPMNGGISQVIPITWRFHKCSASRQVCAAFPPHLAGRLRRAPFLSDLSTEWWKSLAFVDVAVSSNGLQSLVRSGRLWISPSPGRPFEAAFLCLSCQAGPVFHKPDDGEP